jgi:dihydroorotate dehydrogenase electron transfer subunit
VDPKAGTFTLFVKAIGAGTRGLVGLPEGGEAMCLGPLGRAFEPPEGTATALLVAGGYGIAPFHFFVGHFPAVPSRVFYGGRTAADLQTHAGFLVEVEVATEDGSAGVRGRVTEPLEAYLDRKRDPVALYACGPEGLLRAVAAIGARRGLPCAVSLDPWMGCGVGTCLSCVVKVRASGRTKYACACTAGPVFDASSIVWGTE